MYIKQEMTNRKCLSRRGAPWFNFVIKQINTQVYNNTTLLQSYKVHFTF